MIRVLVTGATGFLGGHVLARMPAGCEVEVFARGTSDTAHLPAGTKVHVGDLSDADSLAKALAGVDALLNLASLGFGHAPPILEACRRARVPRAVFIGTTAVFTKLPARTKPIRLEAERLIAASGLASTLLRPTMIYGTPGDRNVWRLIRFVRRSPVVPLPPAAGRQQPVYVGDVANAVWTVLENPATIGHAYNIGGADAFSMREMVQIVCRVLGKSRVIVRVPGVLAAAVCAASARVPFFPRISTEQLARLAEDKSVDNGPARDAFGHAPIRFEEGVRREIAAERR